MNIALIFSPNWKEYVLIELFAIFKNNPAPVKVYLISDADGRIDTSHIVSHFGEGYNVEFINAENLYKEKITTTYNVSHRFTKYTLYRLLLPELIKDDKVLYIDTDAVVCGDLTELWNMEMGKFVVAGAPDIHANKYKLREGAGLSRTDAYVNAGVLLMDLKKIRELEIYDKWIFLVNKKRYAAHDQCIINKSCKNKIINISNKWNSSISTGIYNDKNNVKIVHFTGVKPWDNREVPQAKTWFDAVREYRRVFKEVNA